MDEISIKLAECLNHAKHVRYLSDEYRRAVGYSWGLLIRFS